ncbi:MAG: hypothetical protein GY926_21275 [bacterium]|nr:hypothetical protein [bacterium]
MTSYVIEMLCEHHDVSEFDCGDGFINASLERYFVEILEHRLPLRTRIYVAIDEENEDVAGYVAVSEKETTRPRRMDHLMIAALGVDTHHQKRLRREPVRSLLGMVDGLYGRPNPSGYDGLLGTSVTSRSVGKLFRSLGFVQLKDQFYWFKPL